uniref:Uncharacterized protein n=1 Tax=Tetranychus urticae TaxID=32264 RepID=T1JVX5_TETUR
MERALLDIPYCPLKCNVHESMNAPGAQVPLPLLPRNPNDRNLISQIDMDSMLIKCKYSKCVKLVPYCTYRLHIEHCIHGRCRICNVSNKDHNCAVFVKQLKQKLEKSKRLSRRKDLQIDELRHQLTCEILSNYAENQAQNHHRPGKNDTNVITID